MRYSKELREEYKRTVKLAMMAVPSFMGEVTLYEINEAMRKAYGARFNKKYLSKLRDELQAEQDLLVEKLSTPEGRMELIEELQGRLALLDVMAQTLQ